jgi:hypothetical protein
MSISEKRVLAAWGSGEDVENLTPEELKSELGYRGILVSSR